MVRPAESHRSQDGNLLSSFFGQDIFYSFLPSSTEERVDLADLGRCEEKENEDKEDGRDEEEELHAGIKD